MDTASCELPEILLRTAYETYRGRLIHPIWRRICRRREGEGRFEGSVLLQSGDRIRFTNHSLFRLLAALTANFALVQFRGAVLTAEISAAAVARHESHPDSICGFALFTLSSATGFGHRYVSMTSL